MTRKKRVGSALLIATAMGIVGAPLGRAAAQVDVQTEGGRISGTTDISGAHMFRGIPYARPPVGELRWKEPQPVRPWTGVRSANAFAAHCMQPDFVMLGGQLDGPMSEDCLYLNVMTPAPLGEHPLPVVVWIHGGGFTYGASNWPHYGPTERMLHSGIIVVSFNYRLGAFGFLAHPDLTRESPHHSSGDYGLLDEIAALTWVKRNIASFGGDPNQVTIVGQSAGSISVTALTASPLATGLFQRAIGESGSSLGTTRDSVPTKPLHFAERRGLSFAASLKATSVAELRELSAQEVLAAETRGEHFFAPGAYGPVVEGYVLPDTPARIFERGRQNNVALIAGWNSREGAFFMAPEASGCDSQWSHPRTKEDFTRLAEAVFGGSAEQFLTLYQRRTDATPVDSIERFVGDLAIAWPTWKWANLQAHSGKTSVYIYEFRKSPPPNSLIKLPTHGAELPYVFDDLLDEWQPTALDRQMANIASSYWINFAKTGDPNGPGLPPWPQYHGEEGQLMAFSDSGASTGRVPRDRFDFIDRNPRAGPWCAAAAKEY